MTASGAPRVKAERLLWLDITRSISALMILGIHWLRPGYKLGLIGPSGFNIVMNYQYNSSGFHIFHDMFIAGFTPSLSTWLTNTIGLLGGFGWEAVNVLILLSGFSLALSQRGKTVTIPQWITWLKKRCVRILVPYYLIALPLLAVAAGSLIVLHYIHNNFAEVLEAKLHSQLSEPFLNAAIGHIFLVDPSGHQWSTQWFAPAWWFIPAILLAYLAYPFLRRCSDYGSGVPLLIGSAIVTISAYMATNAGLIFNENWYFIVLNECFNFSLGIVVANLWLGPKRPVLERGLDSRWVFVAACAFFVIGNIADWDTATRPVASMLFGPGLTMILVYISKRLQEWRYATALIAVDPYDLYLVHQPFAFPIALASKALFHNYAVFIGWFIFVAVAAVAAHILTLVQRPIFAKRGIVVPIVSGVGVESAS